MSIWCDVTSLSEGLSIDFIPEAAMADYKQYYQYNIWQFPLEFIIHDDKNRQNVNVLFFFHK